MLLFLRNRFTHKPCEDFKKDPGRMPFPHIWHETRQPPLLNSESVNRGCWLEESDDIQQLEGNGLARLKVNVFYVISAVCSLALIGYAWFAFLPSFEGAAEYWSVRNVVILLTVLLLVVSGIQFVLSVKTEEISQDDDARRLG